MFSRRFATNGGGGGAEYGEWEGGESSSRAAGRGEVAVHGEVLMPLLSPLFRHIKEVKLSLFHSLHDLCIIVSLINAHLSVDYHTTLACILTVDFSSSGQFHCSA